MKDIRKFFVNPKSSQSAKRQSPKENGKPKDEVHKSYTKQPAKRKLENDVEDIEDDFLPDIELNIKSKERPTKKKKQSEEQKQEVKRKTSPKKSPTNSSKKTQKEEEGAEMDIEESQPKKKKVTPKKEPPSLEIIQSDDKSKKSSPKKPSPRKESPKVIKQDKESPKKSPRKETKKEDEKEVTEVKNVEDEDKLVAEKRQEFARRTSSGGSNYFKNYMNRPPPPNKGKKELPVGAPNCLQGKHFLITGVLDSLERDEAIDLIKQYGGGICKTVAKKLTHVVQGLDPGESKLQKLQGTNVQIIDEDGLFQLIATSKEQKLSPGKPYVPPPNAILAPITPHPEPSQKVETSTPGPTKPITAPTDLLWADKHKPRTTRELIGNPTNIQSLKTWLSDWHKHHAGNQQSSEPKAALLSGNPGIGKTSAALLAVRECGFDALEFNASDARGKKAIQEHIADATSTRSIGEFFSKKSSVTQKTKKTCLIMDEVDGMSSGDRGGMAELIQLIKKSTAPIICICNDRSSPKVKSLANYCLDLRFRKPTVDQATKRITEIARREGFAVQPAAMQKLLESVNVDIRQALNLLQMLRSTTNTLSNDDNIKKHLDAASKDIDLGPFDVVPKLFSYGSLSDKLSCYYVDSGLVPLLVQENYLSAASDIHKASAAADSISDSDLLDLYIHKYQFWELSNTHAVTSTIRPAKLAGSHLGGRINFPSWLGKQSTGNKKQRLLRELKIHCGTSTSADKTEMRLSYLPLFKELLLKPLVEKGMEGIDECIELMERYGITREDWESIMELHLGDSEEVKKIASNVKSSFTRTYNALHHPVKTVPIKKTKEPDAELMKEEDSALMEDTQDQEEENVETDKLIKVKKAKKKSNSETKKSSTKKAPSKRKKKS